MSLLPEVPFLLLQKYLGVFIVVIKENSVVLFGVLFTLIDIKTFL